MGRRKWTKQLIQAEFLKYSETGNPLQAKKFRKDNPSLYGAALYHFGSYRKLVESVGIDYSDIADKRRWTDSEVIEAFKKYELDGYEINANELTKHNVALYAQICDRFGSYKQFLEGTLGYDYNEVTKKRKWTKSDIISLLQQREVNGKSLVAGILCDEYFALYKACTTVFGSYQKAIEASGLNYKDAISDLSTSAVYGHLYESTLSDMFTDLKYGYIRHYTGVQGIVPDFFDAEREEFIDAKLSSWTVFNSKTIEKYVPHCNKLIIVYLRGNQIKRKVNGVEFRHVSYYYAELRENGLEHYIHRFDELLAKLNEKEVVA